MGQGRGFSGAKLTIRHMLFTMKHMTRPAHFTSSTRQEVQSYAQAHGHKWGSVCLSVKGQGQGRGRSAYAPVPGLELAGDRPSAGALGYSLVALRALKLGVSTFVPRTRIGGREGQANRPCVTLFGVGQKERCERGGIRGQNKAAWL